MRSASVSWPPGPVSFSFSLAAESEEDIERALADMVREPKLSDIGVPDRSRVASDVTVNLDDASYKERVEAAKEYMRAGDAFQIVLARSFITPRHGRDAFDVYRAFRLLSPSPYMYFLDLPPATEGGERLRIAGASPETIVRLQDGRMTVRPLAGTRPRGKTEEEDQKLRPSSSPSRRSAPST